MIRRLPTAAVLGGMVLAVGVAARQHPTAVTRTAEVTGHVYEPGKLEPTDARVATLQVPDGFRVTRWAEVSNPRVMAVADDGTVYVGQRTPGTLTMLRDTDGDGAADVQKVLAKRENLHGVALDPASRRLYFITTREVYAADRKPDGTLSGVKKIIDNLPDAGQHNNRTLAVGPDRKLYISVGSTCNACDETNVENATLLRAELDGSGRKIVASGLRNTIGFAWQPGTKRLYGMDHGIDWLGDDDQPEELNEIVEGRRYGWPYVYAQGKFNPHPAPPQGYTYASWSAESVQPTLLYTAHSAPMQMLFYTGSQFPEEYRRDAFVAMRGSWNRVPPSGYEVARIRFNAEGRPEKIEPFLTGFLVKGGADGGKDGQFGRLCGLAQMKDGSLLVSDDTNNVIYRVAYAPTGQNGTGPLAGQRELTWNLPPGADAKGTLTVSSPEFTDGGALAEKHSDYGGKTSPALAWSGVPSNAKSLVLMMEDPDAAAPRPFAHWLVANLPATVTSLPGGVENGDRTAALRGGVQGGATTGNVGYYGPRPPAGDPAHRYHFQVFALDTALNLPPGFNRPALLKAMRGHVLAKGQIVGTFQRK